MKALILNILNFEAHGLAATESYKSERLTAKLGQAFNSTLDSDVPKISKGNQQTITNQPTHVWHWTIE